MLVAEKLQAGTAKALLGKAVLPDDVAFSTGAIGLLGTKASWQLMQECDTLLMVGSTFPYSEFLPPGRAGARGPDRYRSRHAEPPLSDGCVADGRCGRHAGSALAASGEEAARRLAGACGNKCRHHVAGRGEKGAHFRHAAQPGTLLLGIFQVYSRRCRSDGGYRHVHHLLRPRRPVEKRHEAAISGTLATMGPAVSYALAAKFAFPDRPAIAFVGDGAMQMLGMNGLITAAKYWKSWTDPRLIVVVLNNRDLNMVSWELRGLGGAPKLAATQNIPDIDYAAQAELLDLQGLTVTHPDDVEPVWELALDAERPVVVDVKADPNVIALPPHASLEQTENFFLAMARGDADRGAILRQLMKQLAA